MVQSPVHHHHYLFTPIMATLQHIILFNVANDNIVRLAMLNDGWFQFREEIMQDINTLLLRFGAIFFTIDFFPY